MKILIIHEIDWITKVPFEPHHLAELFSIAGHDIFVIDCAQPNFKNFMQGIFTSKIQNFHRLYNDASITLIHPASLRIKGLNRLTHFLFCKKIIKKTIQENDIDIILLYGVATNGIQTVQISNELKIPLIFRSLDVAHKLVTIPFLSNLTKKYEKIVINNATKVISTTPNLVQYAKELGRTENIDYFPLGISEQFFKPVAKSKSLMDKVGIINSDQVVGFVGTIYPFAGLDFLINNFNSLKNQIPNLKFLVVGGGPHLDKIKKLTKKLNYESDIIFTGFVNQNELSEYISLFDICVNPFVVNSITDRILPTKILEYLACEKPVLSTPLKGTVELLPDESFGINYAPLENFPNVLVELLNDKTKLKKLGKNGLEYIQTNHNWDDLSERLITVFQDVIENFNRKSNYP